MQLLPKNKNLLVLDLHEFSITFVSIFKFSKMKSPGNLLFASIPPTFAAAKITEEGLCSLNHFSTELKLLKSS